MSKRANYRHLSLLFAVCALSIGITGCGEESDTPGESLRPGNTLVFEGRGRLQCDFTGGITPDQSAMKLIREGVDVMRSGCGAMTDVAFAAVCGGDSGELLLHEIRTANLDTAERAGFHSVAELKVPGGSKGYAWVDCATGAILP
jgi:hypothetical protein